MTCYNVVQVHKVCEKGDGCLICQKEVTAGDEVKDVAMTKRMKPSGEEQRGISTACPQSQTLECSDSNY